MAPRPRRRPAKRPRRSVAPPARPPEALPRRVELREAPHAHAVCRRCGRILEVTVSAFDGAQLTGLTDTGPAGWIVDGISLSMTGVCERCRRADDGP